MTVRRRRGLRHAVPAGLAVLAVSAATGCSTGADGPGTLTVFAAASLQPAFTQLAAAFEQAHPGTRVSYSFAGSSALATQIDQGAPADVFASADETTMQRVVDAGLVTGAPTTFATNSLQIAVAPGNPRGVTGLADLARPGTAVVLCAVQVPCGTAATKAAGAAGVRLAPVSEESSVTDVLNKVVVGEADAGLVYRSDVTTTGDRASGVDFAESSAAVNRYPAAVLTGAKDPALAEDFLTLLTSEQGRTVLAQAGLAAP
ncbi:molybdate ABC transporter substrate-binding protein [Rhodococcus sp. X156]|uniref:molybdate ABC transporter substrate-binding protein n=1 Tax=Rhodococcus sp. X156 TaxID=2499145 RepID=UPI000FD732C2|nr:molybdate ABC transporter substrate-binding protein [Rhodococcus sp. X156]